MNNEIETGKLPNLLEVAAAMEQVSAARPLASSEPLWWNDPKVNQVLNAGVLAGYLSRLSTTQVEWTEAGVTALRVARADHLLLIESRLKIAGTVLELYELNDGFDPRNVTYGDWNAADPLDLQCVVYAYYWVGNDLRQAELDFHVKFGASGDVVDAYARDKRGKIAGTRGDTAQVRVEGDVSETPFPCLFELDEGGEASGTVMPFCSAACFDAAGGVTYPGFKKSKAGTTSVADFGFAPHCEQCGKEIIGEGVKVAEGAEGSASVSSHMASNTANEVRS